MGNGEEARSDTRERLLESASEVFAAKGYSRGTVKEICERAGANIAAVNYYFGSKEDLYAEAWRRAFHESLEKHPPDGGVPEEAPPEERLKGRVRALVNSIADDDDRAFLMAHKEMSSPTCLLEDVKKECVRPLQEAMSSLVHELLGPRATDQQVQFCTLSVVSQCIGVIRRLRHSQMHGEEVPEVAEDIIRKIDDYAEHVARFSLAGIKATRRAAEMNQETVESDERGNTCETS